MIPPLCPLTPTAQRETLRLGLRRRTPVRVDAQAFERGRVQQIGLETVYVRLHERVGRGEVDGDGRQLAQRVGLGQDGRVAARGLGRGCRAARLGLVGRGR